MLPILLLHALYGATFTISKILVQYANPIFVIGTRMTIAGVLLLTLAKIFYTKKLICDRKTLFFLTQISIFGIYFPYVLRYCSLKYLTVTKVALMYNLTPFISYFFSYLFFSEKVTLKKMFGIIIGCASVIPLLIAKAPADEEAVKAFGFLSWPELMMLGSLTSFCYGWIVMKKLLSHQNAPTFAINGRTMLFAGILSLVTSFAIEPSHTIAQPLTFFSWLALIILCTNVICFHYYAVLLKKYSATLLSLGGLVAPVSACITSWLYFGEKISWDFFASGLLVGLGFFIFYQEELAHIKKAS